MATRRRYSRAEKAAAVAQASMTNVEAAADATGIPRTTIDYWMDKPEFVELRNKTSDQVADAMWAVIQQGIRRIAQLIPTTDDLAKVGVAVGILYDKRALLTGMATTRSESRDLTGTMPDADLIAAVDEAVAITGEGRTETEASVPPEG